MSDKMIHIHDDDSNKGMISFAWDIMKDSIEFENI